MAIMEKCNTKIMTLSQGVSTPSRLDFLAQSTSRKFKKEKRRKKKKKKKEEQFIFMILVNVGLLES